MKKITIYKNMEQQKKLEIEKVLKLTPAERIANTVALIQKIYPEIKANTQKRIQFHQ